MKFISLIFVSVLLLTACQPEEKKAEQATEKVEPLKTEQTTTAQPTTETSKTAETASTQENHGHSHEPASSPLLLTGERFKIIEPQVDCDEPVVIEFYAYHCPHCYHLEPAAVAWREKNAGKIKFVSVPTDLGHNQMGSLVLVHHAAKILGVLEKAKQALFNRYHVEKKLFASADEAAQFLVEQGADLEKAKAVLADQKTLSDSMRADFDLLNLYKVSSVPMVLVNHQYSTDITMSGGTEQVFQTVDETLKLESSCKAK